MTAKCTALALLFLVNSALPLRAGDEPPKQAKKDTEAALQTDTIETSYGDLKITFIGHGTLMFTFNNRVIHVDPWTKLTDYAKLPKADIILVTHEHPDHFDAELIKTIKKKKAEVIGNPASARALPGTVAMKNGEKKSVYGVTIEAIPAYNIRHMRSHQMPWHPKGTGNGYVLTFGDKRIYVAGDTENTREMKALKNIHCAFLPMNLPYTMTPEMVADAAKAMKPKILYPYHYGKTEPAKLVNLLKDSGIEVRVRNMR